MSTADKIALAIFIATCIYVSLTGLYVWLVFETLRYIRRQLENQEKERRFQAALTVFQDLQTQESFNARKYIYENIPESIEGVDNNQLKEHFQKAEIALIALDRIGYLVSKDHIDITTVMENYWYVIWRCWKKSKNILNWMREQRGEPKYFDKFEYLFDLSEVHRIQNHFGEPKFY